MLRPHFLLAACMAVTASPNRPLSAPIHREGGFIHLLPALPTAWPTGSVTGLRARGGFEVDITWADHRLVSATIRSAQGGTTRLRYADTTRELTLPHGGSFTWDGQP